MLEPREAEDYFVYQCGGEEEGKVFLVHGSHGEVEGCCVRLCWIPMVAYPGLGLEKERKAGMR
jgi:hypothetical protein